VTISNPSRLQFLTRQKDVWGTMASAGHELLRFVAATEIGLIDNPLGLLCDVAAALQEGQRQGAQRCCNSAMA